MSWSLHTRKRGFYQTGRLFLESNMFATMGYTKSYYYCLYFFLLFFPKKKNQYSILPVRPAVGTRRFPHASNSESGSMSPNPKIAPSPRNTPSLHSRENAVVQSFLPKMHPRSHVTPSSFSSVAPFPFSMAAVIRARRCRRIRTHHLKGGRKSREKKQG